MSRKVFRRGVTETDTTLSNLGEIGDVRFEGGKQYRLVYTIASQADKAFLGWATADGNWGSYSVEAGASTKPIVGYNATGASIAATTYFWALQDGSIAVLSGDLGGAIGASRYVALSSDETFMDLATASGFGTAIVGVANVAIATDAADGIASIWLHLPSQSGGPVS